MRERLASGGIVALNVAAVPDDERLLQAIGRTLGAELRRCSVARTSLQHDRGGSYRSRAEARAPAQVRPADLEPLRDLLARDVRPAATGDPWTDDYAPVEWLTDRMIISYAARAGASKGLPSDAAGAVISLERRGDRPLVIGHKGATALAPENTLAGFRAAVTAGVDLVEFDVLALARGDGVIAARRTCTS